MAGFAEHGMRVNISKTRLSFDMSIGGVPVPRHQYVAPNGEAFIKWCGLLINSKTLNVQVSEPPTLPALPPFKCVVQLCTHSATPPSVVPVINSLKRPGMK